MLAALTEDPPREGMAVRATEIGVRCGDADLCAFGTLAHGQALIAMGEPTRALRGSMP